MIILDTNVVSEGFRVRPDVVVRTWLNTQRPMDLFLCVPVLAELRFGVEQLPQGSRRTELDLLISNMETRIFGNRLLGIDRETAYEFGRVVAKRKRIGRPIAPMDAWIAAIAITHGMAIATRDLRDFAELGIDVINPFEHEPAR